MQTRRTFLKQTAAIGGSALAAPMIVPGSVLGLNGAVAPSNRITVGGIGLGRRGRQVLSAFFQQPDFQFLAIADPDKEKREIVQRLAMRKHGVKQCDTYVDMHDVLGRDDIDAVLIATGDRWHATASIYAARAGKDIFCEKPCAMNIQECRELDEAVLKHKRVFQAGTQRRSVPNFALAVELARSGKLGKLHTVHAGIAQLVDYKAALPEEPLPDPETLDWDKWVGPAPMVPYNSGYFKKGWREYNGFSAAYLFPDWGTHTVDLCQWAVDAEKTAPVEYETDGSTVIGTYADGIKLVMRLARGPNKTEWIPGQGPLPVRFEGDQGWVEAADFKAISVSDPKLIEGRSYDKLSGQNAVDHARNFLDCVKSRQQPVSNSTVSRYSHMACFAAATSWKLGRKVTFDPVSETFPNDKEAETVGTFSYERRAPYTL